MKDAYPLLKGVFNAFRPDASRAKGLPASNLTSIKALAIAALALLFATSATTASAQTSGTCGPNLNWSFAGNTLTITGTGAMDDYYSSVSSSDQPWYTHRNSIRTLSLPAGLTHIGNYAFYNIDYVTSVVIPSSVTSIGSYAFHGINDLTSVTLPNGLISIGNYAFNFTDLTSVTIPASVTTIGDFAFTTCHNLTSISVSSSNTKFESANGILFNKGATELLCYPAGKTGSSYSIPSSVTSIGIGAFMGCMNLTSVTIPNSVIFIGYGAFYDCLNLTNAPLPNNITVIESSLFLRTKLTNVTIPNKVTNIGSMAFFWCSDLTSVTIPSSVTTIDSGAFGSCHTLTNVTFIGNYPTTVQDSLYFDSPSVTTYIYFANSASWDAQVDNGPVVNGAATWLGCPIRLVDPPPTYTITYNNTKGAPNTNPASYTSLTLPLAFTALPDVTGYTFDGWDISGLAVGSTGNKVVTAQWTAITLDPSLPRNNGTSVTISGLDGIFDTADDLTLSPVLTGNDTYRFFTVPFGTTVEGGVLGSLIPVYVNGSVPATLDFGFNALVTYNGIIVPGGSWAHNGNGKFTIGGGSEIYAYMPHAKLIYTVPAGKNVILDPDVPSITTADVPPYTILIPSGVATRDGPPPSVTVPGPDGDIGTTDDVVITPATKDDVNAKTGVVTVPDGSVISTNGIPLVIPGVNNTLVPPGSFPPGTIVLPDGTIVVPANPPNPGTPKGNDDETITVGPGDIIIPPPYNAPFVVPQLPGDELGPYIFYPEIPGIIGGKPNIFVPIGGGNDDGCGCVDCDCDNGGGVGAPVGTLILDDVIDGAEGGIIGLYLPKPETPVTGVIITVTDTNNVTLNITGTIDTDGNVILDDDIDLEGPLTLTVTVGDDDPVTKDGVFVIPSGDALEGLRIIKIEVAGAFNTNRRYMVFGDEENPAFSAGSLLYALPKRGRVDGRLTFNVYVSADADKHFFHIRQI